MIDNDGDIGVSVLAVKVIEEKVNVWLYISIIVILVIIAIVVVITWRKRMAP